MDGGGRRTAGSGRLAGFQLVNHAPNAVSLAALDDLERGGAVKGGVGVLKPGANRLGRNEVFQRGEETLDFSQAPVNQHPIGFDMAITAAGRISMQRVISVFRCERFVGTAWNWAWADLR